jgi:hypothetical protein
VAGHKVGTDALGAGELFEVVQVVDLAGGERDVTAVVVKLLVKVAHGNTRVALVSLSNVRSDQTVAPEIYIEKIKIARLSVLRGLFYETFSIFPADDGLITSFWTLFPDPKKGESAGSR